MKLSPQTPIPVRRFQAAHRSIPALHRTFRPGGLARFAPIRSRPATRVPATRRTRPTSFAYLPDAFLLRRLIYFTPALTRVFTRVRYLWARDRQRSLFGVGRTGDEQVW